MDITALVFYAAVCGLLSMWAPNLGGRASRLAIGAIVGVIAAALLPLIRSVFG